MKFSKVKGTIDFYPEEMEIRNLIFDSLRNTANKFGFQEVESSAMETLDMLEAKAGEEIKQQLFSIEKKGSETYALRAELTPSITRMYVEKQKELPKPVKWYGLSRMWRYERPQAGRLREFYQLSAELFGSDNPESDAEIINLAITCLTDFGLTSKDFIVKINNRKLLQGILLTFVSKTNLDSLISLVDKKEKLSQKDFDTSLKDLGVKDIKKLNELLNIKSLNDLKYLKLNPESKQGFDELQQVIKLLDKKCVEVSLTTARGLTYYTGTVFEIFDKNGKFRSIAGGGRYNQLVELLGGEPCPTTGFAVGYATLSLLLEDKKLLPKPESNLDYYIIVIGDKSKKVFDIISKLRQKNSVDFDITGKSVKKQMDIANKLKAKQVIIIGEKELNSGKLTIKDMKTGTEKKIDISKM